MLGVELDEYGSLSDAGAPSAKSVGGEVEIFSRTIVRGSLDGTLRIKLVVRQMV